MKYYLKFGVIVLMTIIMFAAIGCEDNVTNTGPDNTTNEDVSYIRVIHSAASTGNLNFYYKAVDSEDEYSLVDDVSYNSQYGYYGFYTQTLTYITYYTNTSIAASLTTLTMEKDKSYTIIASDLDASANPSLMIYNDTDETPNEGNVFLRFINLSTDAPDISVVTADDQTQPVVSNLSRYDASSYTELSAGTYKFEITNSDSGENLLKMAPATFTSGVIYTIIFSGAVGDILNVDFNARVYQDTSVQ